eukprot:GEMP01061550.1.p1 GENE.GEMP01061550.1~~GEMP01061550.1.p1  ORF type:complete len:207 (+),score=51.80 GEMP01061550.1:63-683(+)
MVLPRILWVVLLGVATAQFGFGDDEGEEEHAAPEPTPEPAQTPEPTPAPAPQPPPAPEPTPSPIPAPISDKPPKDDPEETRRRLTLSALDSVEAELAVAKIPFKRFTWQYCNFQLEDHPNLKGVKTAVDCARKCMELTDDCTHWTFEVITNTCHVKRCEDTVTSGYEEDLFGWVYGLGPAHPEKTGRQLKEVLVQRAKTESRSGDL